MDCVCNCASGIGKLLGGGGGKGEDGVEIDDRPEWLKTIDREREKLVEEQKEIEA